MTVDESAVRRRTEHRDRGERPRTSPIAIRGRQATS